MGLRSVLLVAVLALGSSVDAYSWSPWLSRRAPLDFAPSKLVKRTYGDAAAYADMLFHYPDGVLDLDSLHSQVVMALPYTDASNVANIRCNPVDGTITLSVPVTGPSRSNLDKTIAALEKEFASAASGWFEGMGTKMDVPTRMSPEDRAACVAMRNTTSDSHIFRTLETFDIRKVVEGAWSGIELKLKTAAADQMDHLRRVVADVTVHMGSQDEKMAAAAKLMKRANYDTFGNAKQYSWNWNNKALATATPDKIVPFYHGEASLADGSGSGYVDVSCSSCYFWVKGALKVHIDTGTFSIKILTGKAEMYAYFEGAAETMFEVQVKAEGTFKKTWTQLFQTSPIVVDINGILQIGGQVGVELSYSADLHAGSKTDAIVKVGQRFRFDWGVPIDFMNGKGKLPPARNDKLSETTGAANLNVAYKGEAKISPKATVSLDVLHIAGIDLSVGLQVRIPHTVDAVVQGSFNISAGDAFPTLGVQASLPQCGIYFSYGCFVAPALASKAWLLGITFKVFDYKFPDLKIVQGQGELKCIQNKTNTATSWPSIGTSTTLLTTSASTSTAAITTANATSTTVSVSVSTIPANETSTATALLTISANETATATTLLTIPANETATVSFTTVSANNTSSSSTPLPPLISTTAIDSTLTATVTGLIVTDGSATATATASTAAESGSATDSAAASTTAASASGFETSSTDTGSASASASVSTGGASGAEPTQPTTATATATASTAAESGSTTDSAAASTAAASASGYETSSTATGSAAASASVSTGGASGAEPTQPTTSLAASGTESIVVPTIVSTTSAEASVSTSEVRPIVVPTTAANNIVLTDSATASASAVATGSANAGVSSVSGTASATGSAGATVTGSSTGSGGSGYSTGVVSGGFSTDGSAYSTGAVSGSGSSTTGGASATYSAGGSGGYSTGGVPGGESTTGSGGYSTAVVSGVDTPTSTAGSLTTTTQAKCRMRPTSTLAYGK
ncbi:hypothetical protein BJ742DRAFT_370914 [Cladochytrium replicatum]|nr:hypothetical protein BJ742DRAFT_370914 [Cladochytrium replicatum]